MKHKAFHKLSYGLYIVASEFEGQKAGYIGNTVFQVTSDPPQLAISCHKKNDTTGIILKSGVFSVSVLKQTASTSLIGEFGFMSSSDIDKFARVRWEKSLSGAPVVLDSSLAWFDCRVVQSHDAGTHMLIIGEVLDSCVTDEGEPLTYEFYREKYKMLSPKNSPTYIDKALLEAEEQNEKQDKTGHTENKAVAEPSDDDQEPYICAICGFVYHPEDGDASSGIPPGTPFSEVPDEYRCPICNAGKDYFKPLM